jgi:hypothetical protein
MNNTNNEEKIYRKIKIYDLFKNTTIKKEWFSNFEKEPDYIKIFMLNQ